MEKLALIVIPTYRRSNRIVRAVNSALAQTYRPLKVVVVDDNGKGTSFQLETQKQLQKYIDFQEIIYIVNETNHGGSYSRNQGLFAIESDYITFLDDDDEIYPEKIQKQIETLEEFGDKYSCCYSAYDKLLKDGKRYKSSEKVSGDCLGYALSRSIYVGSGSNLLVRTSIAKQVGGYDISFKKNQDLEFLVKVLKGYKLAYNDESLFAVHYEIRENNFSNETLVNAEIKFINTFKDDINSLGKWKSKCIYKIIALERFRICLGKGKDLENLINCIRNGCGVLTFFRYFIYIVERFIFKKSYGFKLF